MSTADFYLLCSAAQEYCQIDMCCCAMHYCQMQTVNCRSWSMRVTRVGCALQVLGRMEAHPMHVDVCKLAQIARPLQQKIEEVC